MPDITMPNGDVVSFPDDMPKEKIRSLIASKFPAETQSVSQGAGATQVPPQSFSEGLAGDVSQRASNVADFALREDAALAALPFKYAGEAAGAVGDVALRGLKEITPEPIQNMVGSGMEFIAGLEPVQYAAEKWNQFASENPNAAAILAGGMVATGTPGAVAGGAKVAQGVNRKTGKALLERVKSARANRVDTATPEAGSLNPISQGEEVSSLGDVMNKGQVTDLIEGARTQDIGLMRNEALARGGVLGDDIERQVRESDKQFERSVRSTAQSLAGDLTEETSQDTLEAATRVVKKRYENQKKVQGRLMDARNEALASSTLYAKATNDTLGTAIKELTESAQFKVGLPKSEGLAKDLAMFKMLTNPKNKEIKTEELAAWRTGLNDYVGAGTTESALAKSMRGVYDDWVDNELMFAMKEGDSDLANKIIKANQRYSEFKNKYGTNKRSGQAKALQNLLEQEDMTPRKMVNSVFGSSIKGIDNTEQFVKRLIVGSKEGVERTRVQDGFRAGLYQRAFENALDETGNSIKMGKLKKNLSEMIKGDTYKKHLSTPEHDAVTRALIDDLAKYTRATGDKDITNLSGTAPMAARIMQSIGGLPLVRNITMARGSAELLGGLAKKGANAKSVQQVEKSLAEFYKELAPNIEENIKLDLSNKLGTAAVVTGAELTEQMNESE